MMDSKRIKEIMFSLGADLCGIASIDRFDDAPKGYHPLDVLPTCRSVISFGCRFPVGILNCKSDIPYTRVRNSITPKMDAIALNFCIEMEKNRWYAFLFLQMKANGIKILADGGPSFRKNIWRKRRDWGQ